jgi:urease accessory protein
MCPQIVALPGCGQLARMTAHQPIPLMQRSHGAAAVSFDLSAGRARLRDLAQAGSAKVLLPHGGAVPEVVFLNTSGGLTGGDRLSYRVALGAGVRAVATTQTAERAYRAASGMAQVSVVASVGDGGWLDWLPQETILFQASALHRNTRLDLGADAGCLLLESVVLGRAAMGEVVDHLTFRDRREVWRQGRPVIIEPFGLDDATLRAGTAVLDGARAFASLAMVARGASDAVGLVRAVLDEPGVQGAASGWDGRLTLRLCAADGWPLRRQILRVLEVLRQGRPLPRVWQI